jgi:hypothetical protein
LRKAVQVLFEAEKLAAIRSGDFVKAVSVEITSVKNRDFGLLWRYYLPVDIEDGVFHQQKLLIPLRDALTSLCSRIPKPSYPG